MFIKEHVMLQVSAKAKEELPVDPVQLVQYPFQKTTFNLFIFL